MVKILIIIFIFGINYSFGQILENAVITPIEEDIFRKIDVFYYKYFNLVDIKVNVDTSIFDSLENEVIKINYYFDKGNIKQIKGYYSNGKLFGISNFKDNKRDSLQICFFKNDQVAYQSYFEKGKLIAPHISYFENGKLYLIDNEINNKRFQYVFYDTGQIEEEYLANEINDSLKDQFITRKYYNNGFLKSIDSANFGKSMFVLYYSNGQKEWEGFEYNALWSQIGKWLEWYDNGTKKREYYFNESIPNIKEGTWKW